MMTAPLQPAVRLARRRRCRGLTVAEMLVTMALVGITATVASLQVAPALHSAAGRGAAQQLAADLRLVRMKAIAQNTRYRVVFDEVQETYMIQRESGFGNFVDDEGPFSLPASASLENAIPDSCIFDSRGGANALTTITVGAPGAGHRTVTVNVLGRITAS